MTAYEVKISRRWAYCIISKSTRAFKIKLCAQNTREYWIYGIYQSETWRAVHISWFTYQRSHSDDCMNSSVLNLGTHLSWRTSNNSIDFVNVKNDFSSIQTIGDSFDSVQLLSLCNAYRHYWIRRRVARVWSCVEIGFPATVFVETTKRD